MAFSLQDQQLLKEQLVKAEVVLLGPGLREDAFGEELVKRVFDSLRKDQILIADGGALGILANGQLPFPSSQLILTPHQRNGKDYLVQLLTIKIQRRLLGLFHLFLKKRF